MRVGGQFPALVEGVAAGFVGACLFGARFAFGQSVRKMGKQSAEREEVGKLTWRKTQYFIFYFN